MKSLPAMRSTARRPLADSRRRPDAVIEPSGKAMAAATSSRRGSLSPMASREIGLRAIVQASTPAATVALMVSVPSACRNVVVRGAYSQFFFIVPPIGPSEAAKVPHESWGAYRGRTFAPNFRVLILPIFGIFWSA